MCRLSDVGKEDNYNYKTETHNASEDRHFRLACPNNCFLYGVFDGHDGARVANFAQQKLPAELILGQLKGVYLKAISQVYAMFFLHFMGFSVKVKGNI